MAKIEISVANVSVALLNSNSSSSCSCNCSINSQIQREPQFRQEADIYVLIFLLTLIWLTTFFLAWVLKSRGDMKEQAFRLLLECIIHTILICGFVFGIGKFILISGTIFEYISVLVLCFYLFLLFGSLLNYLLLNNFDNTIWIQCATINTLVFGISINLNCAIALWDEQKWKKWPQGCIGFSLFGAIMMIYWGMFFLLISLNYSLVDKIRANNFDELIARFSFKDSQKKSVESDAPEETNQLHL